MDKKALTVVKNFKKKAEKKFPFDKVIFFGSRAKKSYRKDSDIDLIVVSKKFRGIDFFKRTSKMYDYWDSDYPVDFLCYTPEEFHKRRDYAFVHMVMEEGVEV